MTATDHPDLAADACEDCPAAVSSTLGVSPVTGGPVLVVTVTHAGSCPWFRTASPDADELASAPAPDRLLVHFRAALGDAPD